MYDVKQQIFAGGALLMELNIEQQKKLLGLARYTIKYYLENRKLPSADMEGEYSDEIFKMLCGAFVTLHIRGRLRGCIGYIKGVKNIPETIIDMSKASSFQDPRFPPLMRDEVDMIDIEISVLSPIEKVNDVSEIVTGRDGLIISNGIRSGLLLPQVATENKWGLDRFLEHTCMKAGLPTDAWKWKDTRIEKFSAQVFGEKELGIPSQV
jgi:AmmeMemoRadiSam system protein A